MQYQRPFVLTAVSSGWNPSTTHVTPGITSKMIIEATTPVAPDNRGHFDTPVRDLPETPEWADRLRALIAAR